MHVNGWDAKNILTNIPGLCLQGPFNLEDWEVAVAWDIVQYMLSKRLFQRPYNGCL